MREILILVESNTTGTGREFARRAAEMGAEPVLITTDPGRYGYVAADDVQYVIADTSDTAELLAAARSLAAEAAVVGVTSSSDYFVLAAAVLARAWRLPGPSPDAVRACQHKGAQRQRLADAGLPGPRYAIAETEDEALVSARRLGFPVVVKPVQGSGSFGVRLCATGDELAEHVRSLLARRVNERNMKIAPGALIEEYIDAQEFSVEIFHGSVAAIVRKHLGSLPYFVEVGHDIPSGLRASDEARLGKFAIEAVRSLGLAWGAAHVEIRMQGSRIAIVEVNARLAGGMIPELVRRCCGADLVRLQVGAALGRVAEASRADNTRAASIRFLVAGQNATLRETGHAIAKVRSLPGVADAAVYKAANDHIAPAVDFRGRIGHVLTISDDAATARRTADEYAAVLRDEILARQHDYGVDTGRLNTALADEARQIVYARYQDGRTDELAAELLAISEIDRACLVMLAEEHIADVAAVRRMLRQIGELRGSHFSAVRDRPMPRGLYLAYESCLCEVLGEEVGGVAHAGRSRNDLNAAVLRLRAREPYAGLVTAAARLCEELLAGADRYRDVIMPAYTHGQAAVPVTYGQYLAALAYPVTRAIDNLLLAGGELEINPLGAGAVGGTSIPIDTRRTTVLLGFARPAANSIDAVASRDFALQMLAAATILGVGLTRAAHDFSLWSTEEFGFLHVPDDLVGSSSMMPQKRNPFLLEHVQGKAAGCLGSFAGAVSAMSTAAYTNAIAVGTEGVEHLWTGLRGVTDAANLLRLIVAGTEPAGERMRQRAEAGNTVATHLAELLVRRAVAFRTAHHRVGKMVTVALEKGEPLSKVAGIDADRLTPATVARAARYGGGPGSATTPERLGELGSELQRLRGVLTDRRQRWEQGRCLLNEAVKQIAGDQSQ